MIQAVQSASLPTAPLCRALGVAPATFYRRRQRRMLAPAPQPRLSPRALDEAERQSVLDVLDSPRFADKSPSAVYAQMLDHGQYLCSIRTMYRILKDNDQVRERRNQLRHPPYVKPQLLATAPNQVWSWDITKLLGPVKWTYFYLYVILDIFSRFAVGWMIASRESKALATRLIAETIHKQSVSPGQLTLHADRGASMRSKPLALLLSDLGVTKTHSRPHTSNDNPFSESHFKTLKYRPQFPARFGSIQDARAFCQEFFLWYNTQHYHSALALLTPQCVHYGQAQDIVRRRNHVLLQAATRHPQRFVHGVPSAPTPPSAVWINPPDRLKTHNPLLTKSQGEVSHSH